MTNTPHTGTITAGIDLLAEMRDLEDSRRRTVAGFRDAHGDIRPECYRDHDEARAYHGCKGADRLEGWIDRLTAVRVGTTPQP